MSALANIAITMSSREIADLTKKAHKNVKVDILKMLAELGEDALTFQRIYRDSQNRKQVEYVLDRELTETLLTGYSALLRRKVIVRLRQLEEQIANAEKTNLQLMLTLLAKESASEARASLGSRLLNTRKREIRPLRQAIEELKSKMQPSLLN